MVFEQMLGRFREAGLLKAGGQQRTASTHILGAIRALNRLELVGEAVRGALNALAAVVPAWLQAWVPASWFEQYGVPFTEYRLPNAKVERETLALEIGRDGLRLLEQVYAAQAYPWLGTLAAVESLRRIWVQQYSLEQAHLSWRAEEDTPTTGVRMASPFDLEARRGKKRDTQWVGYKVHLTETCDPDAPHLMTHVETRAANEGDGAVTEMVHQALQVHQWLPKEPLVDTAYVSAELLLKSRKDFQVTLIGPVLPDSRWQALEQSGYDLTHFTLDWERQVVTCPQGKQSHPWKETPDRHGKVVWHALFQVSDGLPCPVRALCTRRASKRRGIPVRPHAEHLALQEARQEQATQAFKKKHAVRAGGEGLISTTAFILGMRRTRYRGRAKTHFQHLATAARLNLKRVVYRLMGIPCITTRTSNFAALAPS